MTDSCDRTIPFSNSNLPGTLYDCIIFRLLSGQSSEMQFVTIRMMNSGIFVNIFVAIFFYLVVGVSGAPCAPPPAVECKSGECQVWNYQGLWDDHALCKSMGARWPTSEAELLRIVASAVKNKQNIRVVSTHAHSLPKLVCAGSHGILISTQNYASVIQVDKAAMTITVQAGAMMNDVTEAAAIEGLTLPAMMYWNGVSAAGMISTGAHGSGLAGKGSGVYEYVTRMRLIVPAAPSEGHAKVITLTEYDEDMKGARISLGVLGVISELTFSLEPMFKRSVTANLKDDSVMEGETESFMRAHEYADIYWIPSHGKALFRKISRVSLDVPGNGVNAMLAPLTVANIDASAKTDLIHEKGDAATVCASLEQKMLFLATNGGEFLNDGKRFTGYPIVGFNHRMQASGGCLTVYEGHMSSTTTTCTADQVLDKDANVCPALEQPTLFPVANGSAFLSDGKQLMDYPIIGFNHRMQASCGFQTVFNGNMPSTTTTWEPKQVLDKNATVCRWDRRLSTTRIFDVELRVPMSRLRDVIGDIKKIRDLNPWILCDRTGILMRSIKKSDAYLGPQEDVITVELIYNRPRQKGIPKWNEEVFQEIEQMLVEKHGGVLHWGKSGGYLFSGQGKRAINYENFMAVKDKYDPEGIFSNDWTDGLFGIGGKVNEEVGDGCALDKMCKCSQDKHCAPDKGYFCRPGRVWQNARVCRKLA